jgi:hypothetical protein
MKLSIRLALLFSVTAALMLSTSCGGGGNNTTPPAPLAPSFSSTPVSAASEGSTYSYQLAATDPSGGTVTFALTAAPTGATLNGNAISWIPTATQSRLPNNFAVTAASSKGGSATQSWTVTPTGTVRVSWVDNYWNGGNTPTNVPYDWTPVAPFVGALLPRSDGDVTALTGMGGPDGQLAIPNVPGGYYWLQVSPWEMYWTNSSTIDVGSDFNTPNTIFRSLPGSYPETPITLNVTGIEPATGGWLQVDLFPWMIFGHSLWGGETSFSTTFTTNLDWSLVKSGEGLEYKPVTLGSLSGIALGPTATLKDLTLTNGVPNTIDVPLMPSPQASMNLSIKGSAWVPLFNKVAPGAATPYSTPFDLSVDPDITNRNPGPNFGRTIRLLAPLAVATDPRWNRLGFAYPIRTTCGHGGRGGLSLAFPGTGGFTLPPIAVPALLTDQDMGVVNFGDPFPAAWTRYFEICQQASVDVPSPDGTSTPQKWILTNGAMMPTPNAPVGPMIGPVENPTINDHDLFTPTTITSSRVTLKWSKPALGSPTGYLIVVITPLILTNSETVYAERYFLGTKTTSVMLPGNLMRPGKYMFLITALKDGRADLEVSPRRTAVPMANADIISATITIAAQ